MTSERTVVARVLDEELGRARASETDLAADLHAIMEASTQASSDDEHDPEGATVGYERALVTSLLSEARRRVTDLEEATRRLAAGAYGTCEGCGQPIGVERLTANPTAVACVTCAAEASQRSPLRRR